ncbi:hypothetical protein BS78_K295000 [Paspalum vaginatum]|uniref:Uncharacterized protein n=1 Tax=Paspalum vaginatum TaxID=158149 RepID=A0A9W8CDS0_9POAL|nr:hypothetical protein BS78_K295000 [Paspalum vaginatum]
MAKAQRPNARKAFPSDREPSDRAPSPAPRLGRLRHAAAARASAPPPAPRIGGFPARCHAGRQLLLGSHAACPGSQRCSTPPRSVDDGCLPRTGSWPSGRRHATPDRHNTASSAPVPRHSAGSLRRCDLPGLPVA